MKIAFVSPFFGADASGGAEAECRHTAIRLAESGVEVDILTTCLVDLPHGLTNNIHRPGVSDDCGLTVRRFRAERPDMAPFAALNDRVIDGETLLPREELQLMARLVNSFDLYRYIAAEGGAFDAICFIPYLFGTSCFGSRIRPDKSVLIPCLHDEGYARMQLVRDMFGIVARAVFHTPAEKRQAERMYGLDSERGLLVGEGVDTEFSSDAQRFRARFEIDDPFILYAGRRDRTKNVHSLLSCFAGYKEACPSSLKLVLIGPGELPIELQRDDIIDLGFVSDQEKKDAYSAAMLLCQPSLNESFSIVMMESWACGTPCLVHEGCEVTRDHVTMSGGGLYFRAQSDFSGVLNRFMTDPALCDAMGRAGRRYVLDNFTWPRIVARFKEEVFAPMCGLKSEWV